MITNDENIERVKTSLDEKIAKLLKVVYILKEKDGIDPWDLGMQEGQLLTLEYVRKELECDEAVRIAMFERTMDRLISARNQ